MKNVFGKIATIVIAVAIFVVDQIATIVVGVATISVFATIVIDCDNCEQFRKLFVALSIGFSILTC